MAGQLEYSTTPASNTGINSIGIQGTNSISNVDNALRQMMADTASAVTRHVTKTVGSYTALKADYNQLWRATGAVTVNLTAAATLTDGWCIWLKADGGAITVDPNASEQINGATTISVPSGSSAFVVCTGTAFYAIVMADVPNVPWTAASSAGPATLAFAEDTDNGTNKISLKAPAAVTADVDVSFQDSAGVLALLDVENQAVTGGATVTSKSLGTQSSGTLTLDMGDRSLQHYTNNGAHTLAPGSVTGSCIVDITNGASAGAITTSGWTIALGTDLLTTTNGHKFRAHCSVGNGGSLLSIVPLQGTVLSGQGVAKAWVNFNGTGTVAIRDSFNVSSITDNGTGDYTVNFTDAMPNANYAALVTGTGFSSTDTSRHAVIKGDLSTGATLKSTTQLSVISGQTPSSTKQDMAEINVVIFGD